MNISHKVLKRFVKDYKLPIQIVQEPYFSYYINLYDGQYNTKSKLKILEDTLSKFDSEDEFLAEYYKIRDNIIFTLEDREIYKEYNTMKMDKFNVPNNGYPSSDIFKMNNVEKYFISIDLVKANFQALKWFSDDIVLNCNTYEELIRKFTDEKTYNYFKDSKYLRQVIFGHMNPKRQVKIQRYMIEQVIELLFKGSTVTKENIRMVSNDEIVLEINKETANSIISVDLISFIKQNLGFDVDIEIYKLDNIKDSKDYFIKEFINKEGYELMCIPLVYHAQLYKMYNKLELTENDLLFYYENQICKFVNPLNL